MKTIKFKHYEIQYKLNGKWEDYHHFKRMADAEDMLVFFRRADPKTQWRLVKVEGTKTETEIK